MINEMISDQLSNWSDAREQERVLLETEASPACSAALAVQRHTPRLSHRAIQALRKAWLPLCKWTWARTEVLPIDQPTGSSTPDALCSTELGGSSRALSGRLSESPRDPGRNHEHQPRALEATRAFLGRSDAAYGRHDCCADHRLWRGRGLAGKHARGCLAGRERREREAGGAP